MLSNRMYVQILQRIMSERKVVIKNADMSEDMQQDAMEVASNALDNYSGEQETADFMKKQFELKYSPIWHCTVGRDFGDYKPLTAEHFIYFYIGQVAVLLHKDK